MLHGDSDRLRLTHNTSELSFHGGATRVSAVVSQRGLLCRARRACGASRTAARGR